MNSKYSEWSHARLVERVTELEAKLSSQTSSLLETSKQPQSSPPTTEPHNGRPNNVRAERAFDPSKYSTRFIALKLAYLGQRYHGFEYARNNKTPNPTIEEELWKALIKTRLIFPRDTSPIHPGEVNWDGCEYSKCGRTDKGVSAFGQVVGIRVRSNRPLARRKTEEDRVKGNMYHTHPRPGSVEIAAGPLGAIDDQPPYEDEDEAISFLDDSDFNDALSFDYIKDEIPYPHVLNRVLPPDIRILGWCPSPPSDFSARFSCKERRYRYFFTQPAFPPVPGLVGLSEFVDVRGRRRREGWLDIQAMREGAKFFEGAHDFRNFCKVDPTKQLTSFERNIFYADIEEVDPRSGSVGFVGRQKTELSAEDLSTVTSEDGILGYEDPPKVYAFTVHGSSFLWHQVRHMAGILFLIGQGLELPSVIPTLLDVENQPTKPHYEMADDAPLVLWDCIFPKSDDNSREDALQWVYVDRTDSVGSGSDSTTRDGKFGTGGLVENIWEIWRRKKIDELLAGSLLDIIVSQGNQDTQASNTAGQDGASEVAKRQTGRGRSQKVFQGGNGPSLKGTWIPVLQRKRMDTVEAINARYAVKKALESGASTEERESGWRKVAIKRKDSTHRTDE